MQNKATAGATRKYASKFPDLHYNQLADAGLYCSQAGFGSYRIHPAVNEHKAALEHALLSGINLIDTSANYTDGGSEDLIGHVLNDLFAQGKIERDAMIIVSKAGYLQGKNYQESQKRKNNNSAWPDLVEYSRGIEHCIHPEFLEDQLNRSLERLKVKTIDIYLLHNPEYYLSWAYQIGIPLQEARQEYYQRISRAFNYLEKEVARGRIQFYGISSNSFPGRPDDYNFTCLETIWHIAGNISANNHFRMVQMPINLLEHQAITRVTQPCKKSVLDFAIDKNFGILTNRPFNAFIRNRLFRLTDITGSLDMNLEELENNLNALIRQENYFDEKLIETFELDTPAKKEIREIFSTGSYLAVNWQKLGPYQLWIESQSRFLTDRINHGMNILTSYPGLNDQQKKWIDLYIDTFNKALDGLTARYRTKAAREIDSLKKVIRGIDEQWDGANKMTHKALRALRTIQGVSCVLSGMRHIDYVNDILAELKEPVDIKVEKQNWFKLEKRLEDYFSE
ncbi:MAG: aldo/keto reductase [Calditrichaceae bacterium]